MISRAARRLHALAALYTNSLPLSLSSIQSPPESRINYRVVCDVCILVQQTRVDSQQREERAPQHNADLSYTYTQKQVYSFDDGAAVGPLIIRGREIERLGLIIEQIRVERKRVREREAGEGVKYCACESKRGETKLRAGREEVGQPTLRAALVFARTPHSNRITLDCSSPECDTKTHTVYIILLSLSLTHSSRV